MIIRPYKKQDYRFVQEICTASFAKQDSRNAQLAQAERQDACKRAAICAMHCDYYLDCEPQFCLVAEEGEELVGYVLCAADCNGYFQQMMDNYLNLVKKTSSNYFPCAAEVKLNQRYGKLGYTAHIRLVLSENCPQETENALMQAMLDLLTQHYVEGVYAICKQKSVQTTLFEQFGFEDIDYVAGNVVYGKKLYTQFDQ